ncbi:MULTISPECIES: universal stress protein [unclassified Brevibacterium]|uniref:universal stress protein n=1 Tax=unclassified Brevibacterium TaxID=2614124 RepID=UPI000C61437A|nr:MULTISPECIES: universal stress protein [unclassified Brevibacterium]SMX89769.1 Nucleotide-binding universal stress protein, UspA family [Brevibacterium sp. 239c]
MSIVVGVVPGRDPRPPVRLGALMARSYGRRLVLVSIISRPWGSGGSGVDAEYRRYRESETARCLEAAATMVPDGIAVEQLSREAHSPRSGLRRVCREIGAHRLVLGSSEDAPVGRIRLGGVSTGLLHSATLPVALAPRGFDAADSERITRISAAFNGTGTSARLVLGAATVASAAGTQLRIVAFTPRQGRATTGLEAGLGADIEDEIVEQWEAEIQQRTQKLITEISEREPTPTRTEAVIGSGETWDEAVADVAWVPGEVLMIGSRTLGALTRLSLGSRAAKILKNAPVPVVLVPHRAGETYAAAADSAR